MILPVLVVIAVLIVAGALFMALRARMQQHADKEERLQQPETETLEYPVPAGQDPVVLLVALRNEGYSAVGDDSGAPPRVIVDCPQGRDRERPRVRAVLKGVRSTGIEGEEMNVDEVVFLDER